MRRRVVDVWRKVLFSAETGGSFFEVGGHSLAAIRLAKQLGISVNYEGHNCIGHSDIGHNCIGHNYIGISVNLLLGRQLETVDDLVAHLMSLPSHRSADAGIVERVPAAMPRSFEHEPIAIVGMSGRWPGIGVTSCEALLDALCQPNWEPIGPPPDGGSGNIKQGFYLDPTLVRGFDCRFWRVDELEAARWDPHIRIFLELAFESLVDAGAIAALRAPDEPLDCGVFASGGSLPHYADHLKAGQSFADLRASDAAAYMDVEINGDKDYVASRTAHALNLIGPAKVIHSACSSALVGIAEAVTALRTRQCAMAVAGGVSVFVPQQAHAFVPGLIWSEDGRCRPFDAAASGTANCNGAQVFVLKRLSTAIDDGDGVYAVIKGQAVRNDGANKMSFAAPSVAGQVDTITRALSDARMSASAVTMIEAHATGTFAGDPIEP